MAIRFMKVKRLVISLLTVALIASQLTGCAVLQKNELLDLISQGETVTIEMTVPNWTPASAAQLADLSWVQLDQLKTYTSTGFRGSVDTALNINTVTTQQGNSKQGCMYVIISNGAEVQSGNTSLRDAFRNKAFIEYWNDANIQNELAEAVEFAYTDIDATSQYAVFATLNAYFNLFNDGDSDDTYGATQSLTREQFMTLMFKAGNGVKDLGDYSQFRNAVVKAGADESYYTRYAAQVADHSYLKTSNGSLNSSNISTPISKLEAIYMVVDAYLKSEVDSLLASSNGNKLSAFGYKDAGDQITDLEINAEGTSSAVENNLLAYLVDTQGEKGIDHTIMAYLTVAEQNGLANGISLNGDLFTSITKDEAIRLMTNVYQAENNLYGYLTTAEYADMDTVEGSGIIADTPEAGEYIVDINNLPADLVGAFEYGYSTVHTEYPDLSPEEQMGMELDLIRQWCDSFVIAIPDNLNEVYSEWHAQYEAALNAIDEGGNTQSGSNTGTNSGTQSGTVDDITPPSNNNSNSSGGNTGSTSKPSTGSSNNGSGTSSGSSSNEEFTPPTEEELEDFFGESTLKPTEGTSEGVLDGSGTYVPDLEDRLDGTQGTISW